MPRTRESAKAAGRTFERQIADYLARQFDDDRIDRRVKTGSKDRGDIGGLRVHGKRLVVECKNTTTGLKLPQWTNEAHLEAGNDDALVGVVIHKRSGTQDPGKQWVSMTVDDLLALMTGQRFGHRAAEVIA
jgi:hypothetical protein